MPVTKQIDTTKLQVQPENALKIKEWLATRGGVFVWESVDFASLGQTSSTPATTPEGQPYPKPGWKFGDKPKEHVTDIARYEVSIDKVVKRFKVGVRMGGQGMSLKVTDAGSRRIRKEVEKAGVGAYYVFDYDSDKNCIILAPDKVVPLAEYDPAVHKPSEDKA
jgi:hypothetical protein